MPKPARKGGYSRVQFDFSALQMERVREIRESLDMSSNAEVVRRSINLMWLCTQGKLYVKSENGTGYAEVKVF